MVAVTLVGVQGQNMLGFGTLQPTEDMPKKSSPTIRHMSNNLVDHADEAKKGREDKGPKVVTGGRHDAQALVYEAEARVVWKRLEWP